MSEILWEPDQQRRERTLLGRFLRRLGFDAADYHAAWRWSVEDPAAFWAALWDDGAVRAERGYDEVLADSRMPGARWFVGAELSVADNLLRRGGAGPAVIAAGEGRDDEVVSWDELRRQVAYLQQGLADLGVRPGDRVAALLPNRAETVVAMLATASLGAVFTSCSPDFGPTAIVDRFGQVDPTVLVACDGYRYAGRTYPLGDKLGRVLEAVPVDHVVTVDVVGEDLGLAHPSVVPWARLVEGGRSEPDTPAWPFAHPLYVLYSSGTTGAPKSIVHGSGGTLLKHLCEHRLHSDVRPGDVVLWYTTCGWMMWNWLVSALASEATIVCYDGSPVHPDAGALWRLAERHGITHFGVSPRYLAALEDAGTVPADLVDTAALRAVMTTGSPLLPHQFDWVYANVAEDVQLASISGGTDIVGCFAGGAPVLPVRRGELQARNLGMAVEAWDERGQPVLGAQGELVCTRPFPSMPLGFWGDADGSRYHAAYFATNPGVWTHGDLIEIREHGGVVIYGRSDTTLNPGGVRIGTAEVYRALAGVEEVTDALAVGRPADGDEEVVLFVTLADGVALDDELGARIRAAIRAEASPRHVPRRIAAVPAVPYTLSGKKVEKAVRELLAGGTVDNRDALANPESLAAFADLDLDRDGR